MHMNQFGSWNSALYVVLCLRDGARADEVVSTLHSQAQETKRRVGLRHEACADLLWHKLFRRIDFWKMLHVAVFKLVRRHTAYTYTC